MLRPSTFAATAAGSSPSTLPARVPGFCFASEIKALLIRDGVSRELDPQAVLSCATYRYCP